MIKQDELKMLVIIFRACSARKIFFLSFCSIDFRTLKLNMIHEKILGKQSLLPNSSYIYIKNIHFSIDKRRSRY